MPQGLQSPNRRAATASPPRMPGLKTSRTAAACSAIQGILSGLLLTPWVLTFDLPPLPLPFWGWLALIMPLEVILVPIFFILIGIQVKLETFFAWPVVTLAGGLLIAAIVGKLTRYKAGETLGSQSALMWSQAAQLSDTDIDNIAAYIATL